MPRETWVYPTKGGSPYLKGTYQPELESRQFTVMPDLPDFVSPIDRKVYSGRAGMREHNSRHDVVPTADLAGLPIRRFHEPISPTPQERKERKERIIHLVNQNWK